MADHTHPITPSPGLIDKWRQEYTTNYSLARQAAHWAADQELEACIDVILAHPWLEHLELLVEVLRAARRPKPPSLAEEGLEALEQIDGWAVANMNHLSIHDDLVTGVEAIRAALERLQELEKGNE